MPNDREANVQELGRMVLDTARKKLIAQRAQEQHQLEEQLRQAAADRLDRAVTVLSRVTGTSAEDAATLLPAEIQAEAEVIIPLDDYRLLYTDEDRAGGVVLYGLSRVQEDRPTGVFLAERQRVTSLLELANAIEALGPLPADFAVYSNGAVEVVVTPQGEHQLQQDPRYTDYQRQD